MGFQVYFQTGLLKSASRWFSVFVGTRFVLALCLAGLLFFGVRFWAAWLLIYLLCYFVFLLLPKTEGKFVRDGQMYCYAIFVKRVRYKRGNIRLSEGLLVVVKDNRIVKRLVISEYSKRVSGQQWVLLIKNKADGICRLFSAERPSGVILGTDVDGNMSLFCNAKTGRVWVVTTEGTGSLACSGRLVAGTEMEFPDWGKVVYYEVAGMEKVEIVRNLYTYDRCEDFFFEENFFWRVERPDGKWILLFLLMFQDCATQAVVAENVPEILFTDEDGTKTLLRYDEASRAYLAEPEQAATWQAGA